jgi:hypothetical protein
MDLFSTYRKMFASFDDEDVVWWYCGMVTSSREGVGPVPLTQAETIMVYRTRDSADDTFTIDWNEVGYFRDINTGERLQGWFNPFSGRTEPYPKSFVDGPARFTVTRQGEGIAVHLVQNSARIDGVTVTPSLNPDSIGLVQRETKTRTFHRPDGTLPGLDSPDATAIETVLSIWSDRKSVEDTAQRNVASHGFYSSGSSKAGGGSWASTQVQGTMFKGATDQRINPVAWDRLRETFPAFFKGDRIAPDWD